MQFTIDHQCPQCGAPAVLEEAERLFNCQFCRVRSYLLGGKFFRYMFEPKAALNREILYVPYWRFKGMMFTCSQQGIDHRFIDTSTIAIESQNYPVSVGLRSQALKLKFVSPETRGEFLKPTLPREGMLSQIERRFIENSKDQIIYSAFVGDHLSLIYSPFYMDQRRIYDAVLEKPITSDLPDMLRVSAEDAEKPNWPIQFIPVICPDCGWDLDGEKDSLTLNCLNCQSSWLSTEKGLLKLKFGIILSKQKDALYLPFWRIKTDVSGIQLNSYKDLVQRANLPKVIQNGMEEKPFYFWVQAFKVRPRIFLRMARKLTIAQPDQEMTSEFPRSKIYPVTLPVTEAVESLKINLAGFVRPAKRVLDRLPEIEIRPERFKLVYIPFHEEHHELIQPEYHLTIHKNMLSMAKNL
jgi:hypothetical protein